MAFKAEELASKIFPDTFPEAGAGLWAGCPQDTLDKGGKPPCPEHTKRPGPPPGPGGHPCPQDTRKPPKKAAGLDRDALVLLQAQLRDRMAQGQAAGV